MFIPAILGKFIFEADRTSPFHTIPPIKAWLNMKITAVRFQLLLEEFPTLHIRAIPPIRYHSRQLKRK